MSYNALLFCPEPRTQRTVTQVLLELDFQIEACHEPFAAVKKLTAEHFDAVVVDCTNEQNAALLFKSSRHSSTNSASLLIAVVEGQTGVASAFRIGANLVLTKPINVEQSKGTIRVARGLLKKSDLPKSTAAATASAQPAVAAAELTSTTTLGALPGSFPKDSPGVSTAVFELEKDPEPKLAPTEAALLESMQDPASDMLRARKAENQAAASVSKPGSTEPGGTSNALAGASLSGQGAAAAAAPAQQEAKKVVAEIPAPSFSTGSGEGSWKKVLLAVLVLLLLAGVAYWVWQKRHAQPTPGALAQPVNQPQAAPAPPLPPANPEPAATTSGDPSADSGSSTRHSGGQEKTPSSSRSAKAKKTAWSVAPSQGGGERASVI